MIKSDFHTHTIFSDGKNTPEEMVIAAIAKGLAAIGISDHAYEPFDDCCMKADDCVGYIKEIYRLKEKYKDKIEVLCGIEYDYYSEGDRSAYEFVIGSVHYLQVNGKVYSVDLSKEEAERCIEEAFGGDKYAYAEAYYEKVGELYEKIEATIIGHFDLITKFSEQGLDFDEDNPRYVAAYRKAMEKLAPHCVFEINYGAVAKGLKSMQYPSDKLVEELKKLKCRFLLCSDAHRAEDVGYFL